MAGRACTVDGCQEPYRARGFCVRHYSQDWYWRHRSRSLEKSKAWKAHHPEKSREYDVAYRERHPGRKSESDRKYRLRDPEAHRQRVRRSRLQRDYGLAEGEFERLAAQQDGKCRICGRARELVVDHDHATGAVRGLLCRPCNLMIGYAGEAEAVLRQAIVYLAEPREGNRT